MIGGFWRPAAFILWKKSTSSLSPTSYGPIRSENTTIHISSQNLNSSHSTRSERSIRHVLIMPLMKWTTGAIGGMQEPLNTARQACTSCRRGGSGSGSTTTRGTGGAVAGWRRRSATSDQLSPPLSLPLPLPPSSASRFLFCPDSGAVAALPGLGATSRRRSPAPPPSTSSSRERPAPPRSATLAREQRHWAPSPPLGAPPERRPTSDSSLL
jgi:hypothetical protein